MSETVLITGASRGIGRACALEFAKNGYNVIIGCSESSPKAFNTLEEVRALSPSSILLPYDVKDPDMTKKSVDYALEIFGKIDSLVLCAGVSCQELFQFTDESAYDLVMDTNVKGAFLTAKNVLPSMISSHKGSIVFVSSMWGQVGASLETVYSASKSALIGMSKALAKEVAPSGIRVNCVSPGVIITDMTATLGEETLCALAQETPLGRNGDAHEVAKAVYFLCSDSSSFITGHDLSVNGGFVIR